MVYKIFIINISAVKAYIYVANETPANIYFDDFSIKHTKAIKVIQENHYYPFGMTIKGLELRGNPDYRFKFNGKERTEVFGWNMDDFGWRHYSSDYINMNKIDRFAEKYYALSPYSAMAGNPIRFVDVNGDSLVVFKNGVYSEIEDDGKEEITGVNRQITTDKDGNETTTETQFTFNDWETDREFVRTKRLGIQFVDPKDIEKNTNFKVASSGFYSRLQFIERESRPSGQTSLLSMKTSEGKMDFFDNGAVPGKKLFVVTGQKSNSVAYNPRDYGNFLWAQAGKRLGFSLLTLKIGAHLNNAFNSRLDNALDDKFEYHILDSKADQRAIRNGYYYNPKQ